MLRRGKKSVYCACEALESRQLMTGTWAALANTLSITSGRRTTNDGAEVMMLLSDGTVMVHGGSGSASAAWYRLTPNSSGNYTSGTFTALASMSLQRLFFASNVLPSGKIFVVGGEYSGANTTQTFTNTGEIYDPVANTWTSVTNFPQTRFGDDPTQLLPDGTVLGGYIAGPQTYIYNPTLNTWAATGTKLLNDRSDEESWVKLPDDSILTYDIEGSINAGIGHSQRYIPSTGTWVDAGTLPFLLTSSSLGEELGPAFLLPDGRAMIFGANGNTAFYTSATNSWSAGPAIPNSLVASDDPGAMLPNGHILIAVAPEEVNDNFPGPTTVFEFDPVAGTYTDVTPSVNGFSISANPFQMNMLVLPSGQVLFANDTSTMAIYTPDGAPNSASRPQIANITSNGSNTFTLTGTTLNGISEGASYGDDNGMASNYPIVRLTDSTGAVKYARTFNWTSTGVALGTPSSVSFTLPTGTAPGPFLVNVIANGIPSPTVLDVQTTAATTTLQAGTGTSTTAVVINGTTVGMFAMSSFAGVIVTGDSTANTININQDFGATRPLVVNGSGGNDILRVNAGSEPITVNGNDGDDEIDIADTSHNLVSVAGNVTVNGGAGADMLVLADTSNTSASLYSIAGGAVTRGGAGAVNYAGDVETLALTTGTASDTVNVNSMPAGTAITLNSAGGNDIVNVGSVAAGGTQGIAAALTITNSANASNLFISDSGDTAGRIVTIDSTQGVTTVSGLAPAAISYNVNDIGSVTLTSGAGDDTINVLRSFNKFTLASAGGVDTANLGAAGAGVQGINSSLNINGFTNLLVDDTGDAAARTAMLSNGSLTGLTSAVINWDNAVTSVTVIGGAGNDTLDVIGTRAGGAMQLSGGAGADTLNIIETDPTDPVVIAASAGDDTVNINADGVGSAAAVFNTTQRIGPLTIGNAGAASLQSGGAVVLTTTALTLAPNSRLDLADDALILDYTGNSPLSDVQSALAAGFNAGAWNGSMIVSSAAAADGAQLHALGYAEASSLGISSYRGQSTDPTSIVIAYTKYGDNNLDGIVDVGNDFNLFLDGVAASNASTWLQGDYTYDGKVDLGNDFNLLYRALTSQGA
jgi:hypothetical protein